MIGRCECVRLPEVWSVSFGVYDFPLPTTTNQGQPANLAPSKQKLQHFHVQNGRKINPKSAFGFNFLLFLACSEFVQLRDCLCAPSGVFSHSFIRTFFFAVDFPMPPWWRFLFCLRLHHIVTSGFFPQFSCLMLFSETISNGRSIGDGGDDDGNVSMKHLLENKLKHEHLSVIIKM